MDDLTTNEHYRLMRVIRGKVSLDPLYNGFSQFFTNITQCEQLYLPSSTSVVPFIQEL
jgi:hypothetical protein